MQLPRSMLLISVYLFVALAFMLTMPRAFGQISTASVNGTVQDSTGAVVPEASVVLTNIHTGVEKRVISNATGSYLILHVEPGQYTLQASRPGFITKKLATFPLAVNQSATFDLNLQVGSVTESVTVEAVGAAIQASTSD